MKKTFVEKQGVKLWGLKSRQLRVSDSPLSLVGALVSTWLSDAVQSLLQQVLPESLSHLSQGIHWKQTQNITRSVSLYYMSTLHNTRHHWAIHIRLLLDFFPPQCTTKYKGFTCVSSLAIDALFRGAAYRPVPVYKEAMPQRVAEPLHGGRNAATGGQTGLSSTTQKATLQRGTKGDMDSQGQG